MASWREKKSKLVRWMGDLAQYNTCFKFFILFGVSLLIWVLILFCNSFHIDKDSARYLLSALVQSQAAIVAIVVTFTLVAVQLVASSYSLRSIDIFKKSPLWWFLTCYGVSIFYGLFVLGLIQEDVPPSEFIILHSSIPLELYIYIAYWFGFVTFALLIVYIGKMFNFLESSNIIKRLSEDITKENILKFIESEEKQNEDQTIPIEEDPIQPIMDVIHGSVMKYDIATTRVGLKAVTDRMIEIIDSDSQKEIITCLCDHFRRVRMLTVAKMDEEATGEVIKSLETFGKSTAKKNLGYATQKITRSIELTGELAAKKGECFDASTWQAVESLKLVEKVVIEKGEKFKTVAVAIALSLSNVAIAAAENKREWPTIWAVSSLEEIGKDAVKHELIRVTRRIVFSLLRVGTIAAEKGLGDATSQAAESLTVLAISSEEIIKIAIQDCESQLREPDRDSFHKFMLVYEQELEKLRAEKSE